MPSRYKRAIWGITQRLGRTYLLGAIDAEARQALREDIAMEAILASLLPSDGTYVDVGANRGQVLHDAMRIAPRGQHIAFEPIPTLAAEVTREFPDVDCRAIAIGASRETSRFCHFTRLDGWSGLRRYPTVSDAQGGPVFIEVEVSTLDAELADITPRLIKIDVEGAEQAVLEGGRDTLARARPAVIFSLAGEGPVTREAFARAGRTVNWLATPDLH